MTKPLCCREKRLRDLAVGDSKSLLQVLLPPPSDEKLVFDPMLNNDEKDAALILIFLRSVIQIRRPCFGLIDLHLKPLKVNSINQSSLMINANLNLLLEGLTLAGKRTRRLFDVMK